nr:EOG090X0O5J [Artemia franciscana]
MACLFFWKVIIKLCKPSVLDKISLSTTLLRTGRTEIALNQVLLLGRCGSDPQKRGSESKPVILFPLATSTYFETNDGTQAVRTDWHRIAVFKIKLGENVVKYMKKGRRVMVQGKILYGEVKDPDGKTRQTTTIAADDVTYVDASRRTED